MKDMRIALATQADLQDWEVDDAPLHDALSQLAEVDQPVWNDPDADWSRYDAVLIRTTWDYNAHREAFVAWARSLRVPLFNPADVLAWNVDKTYLRDLEQAGAPIIPTVWCPETVDVAAAIAGWDRAFLKPTNGATARKTLRFSDWREGQAFLDQCLAEGEVMMLQPYLSRVEERGELSAILFDGRISHTVRKVPVPGDYRVQDDFGASDFLVDVTAEERVLFERIAAAIPFATPLYARIDLIEDDAGAQLITEVELVEPSLFFRHAPQAGEVLAQALVRRASRPGPGATGSG